MRKVPQRGSTKFILIFAIILGPTFLFVPSYKAADSLPASLSDAVFWQMVTEMSEPDGYFQFQNFLSNELGFQYVIPPLIEKSKLGGVYMGVGPEQNFTYIAALQPKLVFIIDIRRQNMIELLMYKALFELSPNRADFVSRLFARKRPNGLNEKSTPDDLFSAFASVRPDPELYKENIQAITDLLVKSHKFALKPGDLEGIDYVYSTFVEAGPYLDYSVGGNRAGGGNPTYEDLMIIDDGKRVQRSYLATEANYQMLREMEKKNLIVPLVGDFAGPKTLRAVGQYAKEHGATVAAFYLSNVEQYLFQGGVASNFFNNVAELPLDSSSTFIRSFSTPLPNFGGVGGGGIFRFQSALSSMTGMLSEFREGRVRSYQDVRNLSQ